MWKAGFQCPADGHHAAEFQIVEGEIGADHGCSGERANQDCRDGPGARLDAEEAMREPAKQAQRDENQIEPRQQYASKYETE